MTKKKQIVVLTGGTGYLGSQILNELLEDGYAVRLTSRNKEKTAQQMWIQKLLEKHQATVDFYAGDLEKEGSFDEALQGADFLIHSASPFKIQGIKDAKKELIDPAVKGTQNVLNAVEKSNTIKRVILTSSIAAIYGDAADNKLLDKETFDESVWNTSSSVKHQPYSYSKTLAEQEAWEINKGKQWELITINPGFIIGPSLVPRTDSTSIRFMLDMLNGKFKIGVPDLYFSVVDVRDVAKAHVRALETENVKGRHVCTNKTMSALNMAEVLKQEVGKRYGKLPSKNLPTWVAYVFTPILAGFSWNYLNKNLGIPFYFDNSKIKKSLTIEFSPVSDTFREHVQQLEKDGLIHSGAMRVKALHQ